MASHESLPTTGEEVKLRIRSVIYANGVPEPPISLGDDYFPEELEDESSDGSQAEEADYPQRLEQVMLAAFAEEDGRVTVTYNDSEILDLPETLTQITFTRDDPGLITVIRTGGLSSMIVVEEGKRHTGEYRLGPYSIPVSFYGRRVRNTVGDGEGCIELEYAVEMSGSDAQVTKMQITLSK